MILFFQTALGFFIVCHQKQSLAFFAFNQEEKKSLGAAGGLKALVQVFKSALSAKRSPPPEEIICIDWHKTAGDSAHRHFLKKISVTSEKR